MMPAILKFNGSFIYSLSFFSFKSQNLKKQLESLGLTFDRSQAREGSQIAESSESAWEARRPHLRKPFCSQDGFCKGMHF
jgi:hypothetical protein